MRLLVCISGHGYGHAAQTAPVINRLVQILPRLEVLIRTAVPESWLRERIASSFEYLPEDVDFGMVMASAIDVKVEESAQRYWNIHKDWSQAVTLEAQKIAQIQADLVLCNVSYLPLAGAAQLGVPSLALCSLNWADIFYHYCHEQPHASQIVSQMLQAYQSAQLFLQCTPSMPMSALQNTLAVGVIASHGRKLRSELERQLGISSTEQIVTVAPGGIPMQIPMENWPAITGVRWITQHICVLERPDVISMAQLQLDFIDLLASSDAVVGKLGYGTVVECVRNQVPLLYVKRGDWPEEPYLIPWLHEHGRAFEITREQFMQGDVASVLSSLHDQSSPEPLQFGGVDCAVNAILALGHL